MKSDIKIPESTDVHLAIAHEYNELFKTHDWTAYLINKKEGAQAGCLKTFEQENGDG